MTINGKKVPYGIGTHAQSIIEWNLPAGYTRFKAFAGLDDGGTGQPNGATVRAMVFTQAPLTQNANRPIVVPLLELGFTGPVRVRDLWQKKGLGIYKGEFAPEVVPHGGRLYRISPL